MKPLHIKNITFVTATFMTFAGAIAFAFSWFFFDNYLPGYAIIAAPGNLFLQLFSEETDFGLKLVLLLLGQFLVSALISYCSLILYFFYKKRLANARR